MRYPTEELASLQEIEEVLCTPGATASVSNIFERYKQTSQMVSPKTYLATRSRVCKTWRRLQG